MNIDLNFKRLLDEEYSIERVFQPEDYDWPSDWEGRALLAFTCHYNIHGKKAPCMDQLVSALAEKTKGNLFFGKPFDGITVDEQQISGHSWYLRGLVEYAKAFDSQEAKDCLKATVEGLYLPIAEWYDRYPLEREKKSGGVSGEVLSSVSGWRLSTDVGCAFMCVDGLAHYYAYTKDERVLTLLKKIISVFDKIDKVKWGFQTHTTLTCTRGILKLFEATGSPELLEIAKKTFYEYTQKGMTLTYQNFNWYGREDSWTEPCAVVDSFILATELYKITENEWYKTLSRRIWFNGLQFCQRENGGAGPDSCVTKEQPVLKISMYEAPFCCTMRYSEGLLEYSKNQELFSWNASGEEELDAYGRRFIDDRLIVLNGDKKEPIFSCCDIAKDRALSLQLKIIY